MTWASHPACWLVLLLVAGAVLAGPLAAAEAGAEAPGAGVPTGDGNRIQAGRALAQIALGALLVAGLGCLVAVLRTIFPGPTRLADESVRRLGVGRLLLAGVLPSVGIALLGAGAQRSGIAGLPLAWGILLGLPALLLALLGAVAAIPHLGGTVLKGGDARSLLARSIVGALTLGLAILAAAWAFPPLGPAVLAVLAGWFLGAGLGVLFLPRTSPPAPPRTPGD
jgi:hypothetical protein